jgi:hypothetical protein
MEHLALWISYSQKAEKIWTGFFLRFPKLKKTGNKKTAVQPYFCDS